MEISINYPKLEKYKSDLIAFKMRSLKNSVEYLENGYFPELEGCTGSSQHQHLEHKREKLETFKDDVMFGVSLESLGLTASDILNALRLLAVEYYERAQDFSQNPFIVMRSLREAVTICNLLKEFAPCLNLYSNYWLCGRNQITL